MDTTPERLKGDAVRHEFFQFERARWYRIRFVRGEKTTSLFVDGRLVLIGLMGGTTGELDLRRTLMKRLQVIGSTLRALPVERKSEIVTSFVDRFGDALEDGRLRPVIDSVFPMERIAEAHRRLASGDAFGKVVLTIGDPERDHSGRG